MTPEQTARVCARLLGWTWWNQRDPVADTASCVVYQVEPGRFTVVVLDRGDEQARYTVDLPTLMLCAMLRHAGGVDVGPCPACEGVRLWRDQYRSGYGTRDAALNFARTVQQRDGKPGRVAGSRNGLTVHWDESCPSCTVTSNPTGREVVPAWRAVLMGSPREWLERDRDGDVLDHGIESGHEGARAALARLADEWRESLPVLADWAESVGWLAERRTAYDLWFGHEGPMASDRTPARFLVERCAAVPGDAELARRSPPVPRSLAECPALPVWIDAWIAGPCADCRGHGRQTWDSHSGEWMPGDNGVSRMQRPCRSCNRSGVAIGPHLDAMSANLLAAAEVDP